MSHRKFCLLYGSQTGQAQSIAEEVRDNSSSFDIIADLHCLSKIDKEFTLEQGKYFVFIVSTTGDGDPPDTALKFWRRLRKITLADNYLQSMRYALLGLGDSNYSNFCNFGKNLNRRLQELGAKPFIEAAFADDATGLEIVVEPWMDSLWEGLMEEFEHSLETADSPKSSDIVDLNHSDRLSNEEHTEICSDKSIKDDLVRQDNTLSEYSAVSLLESSSSLTVSENSVSISEISKNSSTFMQVLETNPDIIDSANNKKDIRTSDIVEPNMDSKFDNQGLINSGSIKTVPNKSTDVHDNNTAMEKKECSLAFSSVLSGSSLTVPHLQPSNLKLSFISSEKLTLKEAEFLDNQMHSSKNQNIVFAEVKSATRLTADDSVKTVLDLCLNFNEEKIEFEPGDSFSIICPNVDNEVNDLLERLGLLNEADSLFEIQILNNNKKAAIPQHLPTKSSLRYVLTHHCDIRAVPKKALIRVLVEYTSDSTEKRRLQELCSRQGNEEFAKYIREPGLSLIDILHTFPSCKPPIERVLESLSSLQPRHYSVASSPLVSSTELHFLFTVVELNHSSDHQKPKQGLCTGWLDKITKHFQRSKANENSDLSSDFQQMQLSSKPKIPIFKRPSNNFRLPDDFSVPIIMIGPGTGVAPFIGFLQHREMQKAAHPEVHFGDIWLFFGCRNKEKDYLYRNELESFLSKGILSELFLAFSRENFNEDGTMQRKYVQHSILENAKKFSDMIVNKNATIFVCGDVKNMAKDVQKAIIQAVKESEDMTEDIATTYIKNMQVNKRYVQDIWL